MDSYFASVEQQANPFFRHRPVGVCAYLHQNGCIIASSIEAKKIGIKTGCRVFAAKKIDPNIILVENDPNKYRSVTKRIFQILTEYSLDFEPYSIDEGFLDLTGWAADFNQAQQIAVKIRSRIKAEIGSWLRCSIGLSFTKFLAKFASDTAEPDELIIIQNKFQADQLFKKSLLTDLWGINFRLEKRLNGLGIKTISDLQTCSPEKLLLFLGRPGYFLWAKVNGLATESLKTPSELLRGHLKTN